MRNSLKRWEQNLQTEEQPLPSPLMSTEYPLFGTSNPVRRRPLRRRCRRHPPHCSSHIHSSRRRSAALRPPPPPPLLPVQARAAVSVVRQKPPIRTKNFLRAGDAVRCRTVIRRVRSLTGKHLTNSYDARCVCIRTVRVWSVLCLTVTSVV